MTETGRIDVLVNSAGVFDGVAGILETSPELWNRVIGINLTGTFNGARAVAEQMVSQRSGRIINISSIAASRAMPDGAAYDASKAGIEATCSKRKPECGSTAFIAVSRAAAAATTARCSASVSVPGRLRNS